MKFTLLTSLRGVARHEAKQSHTLPLTSLRGTKQSHEMRTFIKTCITFCLIHPCLIGFLPFIGFSQTQNESTQSINITLKDHQIFNKGSLIGSYKNILIDSEFTSIVIYNRTKSRIAEATYAKGDENWTIATPVDQEKMNLPWSKGHTLELLFKFLVEKGYL